MGVLFLVDVVKMDPNARALNEVNGNLFETPNMTCVLLNSWPQVAEPAAPAHVPPRVAKAFEEGCKILPTSPTAACTQFRRALEFGLKDLAPDIDAWKLEKRIDKLAADGKLTESLKDWAHHLRIDGNDSVHGEDPSVEHALEVEKLTRYVLTYVYTLPQNIAEARSN